MQGSHAFIVYNNTSLLTTVLLFGFFLFFSSTFKGGEQVAKVGEGGLRPLCTVTTVVGCGHVPTAQLGGSGGMLPQKILEVSTL